MTPEGPKTLDEIRQSVLDHDAPDRAAYNSQLARLQRRNVILVIGMFIVIAVARQIFASMDGMAFARMIATAVLVVWAVALVVGLAVQPLIRAGRLDEMLAHVGATEMEEAAIVVERLPGIGPVVERWIRAHGGLRRLEYLVLHRAGVALLRLDTSKAQAKDAAEAERAARERLMRAVGEREE